MATLPTMESQSRQTASTYINNLLLSRGLLRNGTPIEFAKPEDVEGGIHATMTQVMSLVHDLILRRDVMICFGNILVLKLTLPFPSQREADTTSTLSQNVQSFRHTISQQVQSVSRLEGRNVELERQIAITTAQERAAQATLRSAETRNRALREEMSRLKASVAQIRSQCATDVRRRDGELSRLKRHLEGRRGRDGGSNQVGVVVVTPGLNKQGPTGRICSLEADIDSPEYSLKQETTEFLTQLSQGLSDENDALIGLVRGTLDTLKSLQGLPSEESANGGDNGSDGAYDADGVMIGPPSYETLATSTDEVLEHLRGLLTNPSFVPLEELEIREEEIHRLREGWEMMADRWKEAITLMAGWRRRVMDDGDTIKLEDLKVGLKLGSGIPSAQEARQSPIKIEGGNRLSIDGEYPKATGIAMDASADFDRLDGTVEEVEDVQEISVGRPLCERHTNLPPAPVGAFPIINEESSGIAPDAQDENAVENMEVFKPATEASPVQRSKIPLHVIQFSKAKVDILITANIWQTRTGGRSPETTVAEKLNRAKKEADEARKRAEKRIRHPAAPKNALAKKLKGARRRSTLSPEELENLMSAF